MHKWCVHDEYYMRALAAYYGRQSPTPRSTLRHSVAKYSGTCNVRGKLYVRLSDRHHLLAVYRVKPDGVLRRLVRWPKALEADLKADL